MNRTLTISDRLYEKLESEAQQKGFRTIEQLLEAQHTPDNIPSLEEVALLSDPFERVIALQKRFSAKYGMMPDSADLIREDRER